jgi:hypothetical protein
VTPSSGPFAGGNYVTVIGTSLGDGTDIASALLIGLSAPIVEQTTTRVVLLAPATSVAGLGAVTLSSRLYGTTTLAGAYRYNLPGVITAVTPGSGICSGGQFVSIVGSNLGSGSDVTAVSLNEVAAARIERQTATLIVVTSGGTITASGPGEVVIQSTSFGRTANSSVFTYVPSFVFSPINGSMTEGTNWLSVSVWLDARPSAPLLAPLATNWQRAELAPDTSALLFSSTSWNTPQTVSIRAMDDFIANGNASCPLEARSATSLDTRFNTMNGTNSLRCINDDVVGLVFSNASLSSAYLPTVGGWLLIEGSPAFEMQVRLTSEPLSPVFVTMRSTPSDRLLLSTGNVTILPSQWNVSHIVTVTLVTTTEAEPLSWGSVSATPSSSDPGYNTNALDQSAVFLLVDQSSAGLVQVSPVLANVTEDGASSAFYVMLVELPSEAVPVSLLNPRTDKVRLSVSALELAPADRYLPVPVSLRPEHDQIDDDDQFVEMSVQFPVTLFGATTTVARSVGFWVIDIDTAALTSSRTELVVNETGLLLTAPAAARRLTCHFFVGSTDTFRVWLQTRPVSPVSVQVSCDTAVVLCSPTVLSFTASSWNISQTVTVTGL